MSLYFPCSDASCVDGLGLLAWVHLLAPAEYLCMYCNPPSHTPTACTLFVQYSECTGSQGRTHTKKGGGLHSWMLCDIHFSLCHSTSYLKFIWILKYQLERPHAATPQWLVHCQALTLYFSLLCIIVMPTLGVLPRGTQKNRGSGRHFGGWNGKSPQSLFWVKCHSALNNNSISNSILGLYTVP